MTDVSYETGYFRGVLGEVEHWAEQKGMSLPDACAAAILLVCIMVSLENECDRNIGKMIEGEKY